MLKLPRKNESIFACNTYILFLLNFCAGQFGDLFQVEGQEAGHGLFVRATWERRHTAALLRLSENMLVELSLALGNDFTKQGGVRSVGYILFSLALLGESM